MYRIVFFNPWQDNKRWKKYFPKSILIFILIATTLSFKSSENKPIVIENDDALLVYHLIGGGLKVFQLKSNRTDAFISRKDSIPYGQFVKIISVPAANLSDRPCESLVWDLVNSPILKGNNVEMMMRADYLNENLTIKRFVSFPEKTSSVDVKEEIYNYTEADKTIEFAQQVFLEAEILNGAVFYTNIQTELPREVKQKSLELEDPSLGVVILVNSQKNIFIGYTFDKASYSKLRINSGKPEFILTSDSPSVIHSKTSVTKGYTAFTGIPGKDFKEMTGIRKTADVFLLEANKGKIKYEFRAGSSRSTDKI